MNLGWDMAELKRRGDRREDGGPENEKAQGSDLQHWLVKIGMKKVGCMKTGLRFPGNRVSWHLMGRKLATAHIPIPIQSGPASNSPL